MNQDSYEDKVQNKFLNFLIEFTLDDEPYYQKLAKQMYENSKTTLMLNYNHLQSYEGYDDICSFLHSEFYRFEPYFRKAITQFMFTLFQEANANYHLSVYGLPPAISKIRELKSNFIGQLMQIQGTVTRTSEVRPELVSAQFYCLMCNKKITNIDQQFKFTEPKKCSNPKCDNRTKWHLDLTGSLFTDFQKLRVQEDSKDIPPGCMPRSIDVILRNELCEAAKPGDKCIFVGCLTVVPDIFSLTKPGEKNVITKLSQGDKARGQTQDGITGLKQLGVRDLTYKNIFVANYVETEANRMGGTNAKTFYKDDVDSQDENDPETRIKDFETEELTEIKVMRSQPEIYRNLADSIAPAVKGHDEIKKGILLMLVGGVNKKTKEGVNIRGDVNVCVVGDPSTAKSQFLKFTCQLMPRSVYTSGKSSSAAGLTASVHRDPETGEFAIEAGALMLADNGVCCIDEFDKMDQKDQVAIHEAMEQQTISLAKAGIHATLNARASILAAANPVMGRYDKSKPLKFNVNMSQPIMSRFDLFFIIVDQCSELLDQQIAQHIVRLHRQKEEALDPPYTAEQLKKYIRFARTFNPHFTKESAQYLRKSYVRLRENDSTAQKTSYRITVRQLESLIRLSEALARIHCNTEITIGYVKESERLLSQSILQLDKPAVELDQYDDNEENKQNIDNLLVEELKQREQQKRQKKIQISSDEYYRITKSIEIRLKEIEKEREEEIVEIPGIQQKDLINWYLEQQFDQIENEEQLENYATLIGIIINSMIKKERTIIIVRDNADQSLRYLQLHPNVEL